jgi:hypothetical protein
MNIFSQDNLQKAFLHIMYTQKLIHQNSVKKALLKIYLNTVQKSVVQRGFIFTEVVH